MPRFAALADVHSWLDHHPPGALVARGKWTPGQIFYHLAAAFEVSCEPRPRDMGVPSRLKHAPIRLAALNGRLPRNVAIPDVVADRLTPPDVTDESQEHGRLGRAIEGFESCDLGPGEWLPHPALGPLTGAEWRKFHLQHCSLHLPYIQLAPDA